MQLVVNDVLCQAAHAVQQSFFEVPVVTDGSLSFVVEHLERDESARSWSPSAHYANLEQRQSRIRAASYSKCTSLGSMSWSSAPGFPDAANPHDYPR